MNLSQAIGFEGFEKARAFFCAPTNSSESLTESQVFYFSSSLHFHILIQFLSCFQTILKADYSGDITFRNLFRQIDANSTGTGFFF